MSDTISRTYRLVAVIHDDHGCEELVAEVRRHVNGHQAEVALVAPALNSRLRHWTSDVDEAVTRAAGRAQAAAGELRAAGIVTHARVGDADPVQAIEDVLREFDADEVIVVPARDDQPHWSQRRLIERITLRHPTLPITRVMPPRGPEEPPRAAPPSTARPASWLALTALATLAVLAGWLVLATRHDQAPRSPRALAAPAAAGQTAALHQPAAADSPQARGVAYERYRRPNPALPAVPAGAVKNFRIDVYEHVTRVAGDLAPLRVWGFGVNGKFDRGTGVSPPIVVNEGDRVHVTFVNGASRRMHVTMPHSIDLHAAAVAPNVAFRTLPVGGRLSFSFTASHPGVFLYHCASAPMLLHLGSGMVGMLVVKARNLPPVDREVWLTQQEYYLGAPGQPADYAKMQAKKPDVVAFNGYANQYKEHPIRVHAGERIRAYVLNAGPSLWSAFHVIGTVFDRTDVEGVTGHDAQTISLAPAQGGWVDFTLPQKGAYPFVTHAFGDMAHGADGAFITDGVPASAALPF